MDVSFIAEKLGCSQATARRNLKLLVESDLLKVKAPKGKQIYHLGDTILVQKRREMVWIKAEIPGGGNMELKFNWPF